MQLKTITTCDENNPHTELFLHEDDLNDALKEHYESVWKEVGIEEPCPDTWEAIYEELSWRNVMQARHIAHVKTHELFRSKPVH
ncbi:hypothetical protein ACFOHK_15620 [Falsigemmobacter intermedius]|uniref:Uncharacterized protein n=1 Tax=Falsigemmobacter intermedius TaxID=1553448 RepID=A0A3S3VM56_9RHOB|nr:hypothetical protein [Falsigemmobacter intermedius]RWY38794.1 hypothetical protein EP867_15445 [Falsigemmobacter intermedius]